VRQLFALIEPSQADDPVRSPSGPAGPDASAVGMARSNGRVEHRNGPGQSDPAYQAELLARAHDLASSTGERAFVGERSST
jgi:hypothetical protein